MTLNTTIKRNPNVIKLLIIKKLILFPNVLWILLFKMIKLSHLVAFINKAIVKNPDGK